MSSAAIRDRLAVSIEKEFYFESLFILASLLEGLTKKYNKASTGSNERISFDDSIEFIFGKNLISAEIYTRLTTWRNDRNTIVHDLVTRTIDEQRLQAIITEGKELLEVLDEVLK
jgi:uncharacterized protein YutE (UPF0331/DUF86 family)